MQPFSLLAELGRCFAADSDRYFLWVPVFLAIGVACYFALSVEPPFWLAMFLPVVAGGLLWGVRLRPLAALCSAALFSAALGFAAAIVRADRVAAPVLEKPMSGTLVAEVISAERTEKGALSAVLAPISFAGLVDSERPGKVRLNIRIRDAALRPGATVELRARLMPPPEPVLPRGFDFARQAWFEGLGAVGFAYTAPEERAPPSGAAAALTTLRMKIGERIRGVVGGTSGAVAAALINGERASIPDEVSEDLRAAGIYHVLSISGLHMVLFAGSLFWTVRAALALIPGLALRYPIKKWAAFIAILGATFYLTISGAAIATQRAWIMITLMFVAILLDRPALSMRNVALAAIVILLWRPESLVGASFQMSFAAVVALIAFYETEFARRWTMDAGRGGVSSLLRTVLVYVLGIALTSIVAGAATGCHCGVSFQSRRPLRACGQHGCNAHCRFCGHADGSSRVAADAVRSRRWLTLGDGKRRRGDARDCSRSRGLGWCGPADPRSISFCTAAGGVRRALALPVAGKMAFRRTCTDRARLRDVERRIPARCSGRQRCGTVCRQGWRRRTCLDGIAAVLHGGTMVTP